MLYEKTYLAIGFIRKPFGFKGHMLLALDEIFIDILEEISFIFLELDGYKVPFKIEEVAYHKGIQLKLKHIDSSASIQSLTNKTLFILKDDLPPEFDSQSPESGYVGLEGMYYHDATSSQDGTILSVEEFPQQLMAIVSIEDVDYYIPLVEEFITDIDEVANRINFTLPIGLLPSKN